MPPPPPAATYCWCWVVVRPSAAQTRRRANDTTPRPASTTRPRRRPRWTGSCPPLEHGPHRPLVPPDRFEPPSIPEPEQRAGPRITTGVQGRADGALVLHDVGRQPARALLLRQLMHLHLSLRGCLRAARTSFPATRNRTAASGWKPETRSAARGADRTALGAESSTLRSERLEKPGKRPPACDTGNHPARTLYPRPG